MPIPRGCFPLFPAAPALQTRHCAGRRLRAVRAPPLCPPSSFIGRKASVGGAFALNLTAHWLTERKWARPGAPSRPCPPFPRRASLAARRSWAGGPGRSRAPIGAGRQFRHALPGFRLAGRAGSRSGRGGGRCRWCPWCPGRPAWDAHEPPVSLPHGRRRLEPGRPQVGARGEAGQVRSGAQRGRGAEPRSLPGGSGAAAPAGGAGPGRAERRAASSREKPRPG